ncbi:MAG: NAD-binding protein [Elusimicrobia bacterium]|nr:NAD-binding protein [Elusimicrobiota bacterium]MDE2425801.1 NAD-binding protein [Elusimicrobiota bacterium]
MEQLARVRRRIATLLGVILAVLAGGAAGYHFLEGWPWLDAVYMTVITLGTVGYEETHPLSSGGRVFTMLLILGGIALMTYAFSTITAIIVEGELAGALKRRRMQKEIGRLSGHYIVCGSGHAAGVIGSELLHTRREFVVIDVDQEALRRFSERLGAGRYFTVEGDAAADETLRAAGVARAAGIFAVLPRDQDNAFVALSAKGLNPGIRVVSAQKELGVREQLLRSGADRVVNPEYIGGLRMVSEMIRPATVGFLDAMIRERGQTVRFEEVGVPSGSPFVGRPLEALRAAAAGPLLVALQPAGSGSYEINPPSSRPIAAGDALVLLGEIGQLEALRRGVGGL